LTFFFNIFNSHYYHNDRHLSRQAFLPAPLPPVPDIEWTAELRQPFEQAHFSLGRLDSISSLLPDTSLWLGIWWMHWHLSTLRY
jgi:hypothetical protein